MSSGTVKDYAETWKKYGYMPPMPFDLHQPIRCTPRTDCFACWKPDKHLSPTCTALKHLYCIYGKCNFYKPKPKEEAEHAE